MSALSKPNIYFAGATAPWDAQMVPAESVQNIDKLDIPAGPFSAAQYLLLVNVGIGKNVQTMRIPFATSTLRNFAFTTAKTTIGAAIAAS